MLGLPSLKKAMDANATGMARRSGPKWAGSGPRRAWGSAGPRRPGSLLDRTNSSSRKGDRRCWRFACL